MSITLPPAPRAVDALAVDVGVIRGCGASLLAASAPVDDLGAFVAGRARIGDWTDSAASASYHSAIRVLGRRADAMSLALRAVARRVDQHADRMQALATARDDLVARRKQLARQRALLAGRAAAAATPSLMAELRQECERVRVEVGEHERDVVGWQDAVRAEEQAMVAALDRVGRLDDVERLYGGVPDPADVAVRSMPPPGSSPSQVSAWWDALTGAQQRALVVVSPDTVGNLDGVPAGARDVANTVALDRDLADWGLRRDRRVLSDDEARWLQNAEAADDARHLVEGRVDPVTGEPVPCQLYAYDPRAFDGDGAVAVVAGDLDHADDVAVVVPGLGTDARSAAYLASRAVTLHDASRTLDGSRSNATMAWVGYDAPSDLDAAGVAEEAMATTGGDHLADTLDGVRAGRHGPPAHLTVIGHSYGSTTLGHALHDHPGVGPRVDDAVVVGSPGLGGEVHHATDLHVAPGHVWDGTNSRDPVAALADDGWLGAHTLFGAGLGDDPAEDRFGAVRFEAESTTRGDDLSLGQHSAYFDPDSESLYDIAQVVTGHDDRVLVAAGVHDPWYAGPRDPEWSRPPTAPDTGGGG